MKKTLDTIIETAQEAHDFNKPLFDADIEKGEYAQAFNRRAHAMSQIDGLKNLLIHLLAADQITETDYTRYNDRLHKLWQFTLDWS